MISSGISSTFFTLHDPQVSSSSSDGNFFFLSGSKLIEIIGLMLHIVKLLFSSEPIKEKNACSPCDGMTSLSCRRAMRIHLASTSCIS
jgi:hypothetical protein